MLEEIKIRKEIQHFCKYINEENQNKLLTLFKTSQALIEIII